MGEQERERREKRNKGEEKGEEVEADVSEQELSKSSRKSKVIKAIKGKMSTVKGEENGERSRSTARPRLRSRGDRAGFRGAGRATQSGVSVS